MRAVRHTKAVCLCCFAASALACAASALLCRRLLPEGGVSLIKGFLSLARVTNSGAAFSLLAGAPALVTVLNAAFLCALSAFILKGSMRLCARAALCAVLAGGISNFLERILTGTVTDMIRLDFVRFPVFNFADVCICAGAAVFACAYVCAPARAPQSEG